MADWISVKDRLPDELQIVIIFRETNNKELQIQILKWFKGDETDQNVTHWMPLPEPPK